MAEETQAIVASQEIPMPARIQQAVERAQFLEQVIRRVLKEGVDYGQIPGTPKPTLYQCGAQQLAFVFGLTPRFSVERETLDYDAVPPRISYVVRCQMIGRETGEVIADGLGAASSLETRYRYRRTGDGRRVENTETADLQNTLLKMAGKRALVAAVLNGTGASRLFTQDLEDLRDLAQAHMADDEPSASPKSYAPNRTRPAPATEATAPRATEAQVRMLWARAKAAGVGEEDLHRAVAARFGAKHLQDLTRHQASRLADDLSRIASGDLTLEGLMAEGEE